MNDEQENLVTSLKAHVDLLLTEFKQAGMQPGNGLEQRQAEEVRRMIWAGQSPDGRKWDELMEEGQPALPWNGCSDTRVPVVDGVVNDAVDLLTAAFRKAELRATTVNADQQEIAAGISAYLHWLVSTRHRKALRLEAELAAQYAHEYGYCLAYIGWERELSKRRVHFTMAQVQQLAQSAPEGSALRELPGMLLDPAQDAASAEMLRSIYRLYVMQAMQGSGFYEQELEDETLLDLKLSLAKRYVRELRDEGEADVPMPYVCKNHALVQVCKPVTEIVVARGTRTLQQARAIFWRRWMTEAELESKRADGWEPAWIEAVLKTKGAQAHWGPDTAGPVLKTMGDVTYQRVDLAGSELIEVIYAYVKKVDEDGVTGVYETIFSPHATHDEEGGCDFCASHELLSYAHGQYPFVEYKRENLGRGLTESRSVADVASTWQNEEKKQRDTLFNRADWDTLPPVAVPKLGGVDLKLGPGAQVPLNRNQEVRAINLGAPPATLALELIHLLRLQTAGYFGTFNTEVHPAKLAIRQEKMSDDFYIFWGEVLGQVFALTLQYNPEQIVRVTGNQALAGLDPFVVMDELLLGMEFDVKDLNPDYLLQKLDIIHGKILPADVTGAIDRAGLTAYEARAVDPSLAQRFIQDGKTASQKVYNDVRGQLSSMMLGFEAEYTENDPTAPMKFQFLQTLMQSNPKVQQWMQQDERFKALLDNYAKNLKMSVMQQQNQQIGRIGVKPVGPQM